MSLYHLELRLSGAGARRSGVRAWIDPAAGSLDQEIEVHLQRFGEGWRGAFLLPRGCAAGFYYRVGITARVGSWWSLRIHEVSLNLELTQDADRMSEPKAWILGSCGPEEDGTRTLRVRHRSQPTAPELIVSRSSRVQVDAPAFSGPAVPGKVRARARP